MKTHEVSKALALGLALACFLALGTTTGSAQVEQPRPGPIPPEPVRLVNLVVGCNNVALTYPDGTSVNVVVGSISPPGALYALWRLNPTPVTPTTGPAYEGFAPAAPQASDLQGVNFLEAVFLCVSVPSTITMPAVMAYPIPYPIPVPEGTVEPSAGS
jgi:hypothetical protein